MTIGEATMDGIPRLVSLRQPIGVPTRLNVLLNRFNESVVIAKGGQNSLGVLVRQGEMNSSNVRPSILHALLTEEEKTTTH